MSSNPATPYDEERMNRSMLESELPDTGFDSTSEFALEQFLELLLVDSSADGDDDADITPNFAHPSMSDQESFERQWNISAESGTSLAAVHPQAEHTHQFHAVSGPNCWIGLSVGWPQTDASFTHFGMVHWSHIPYISISSQHMLPQTFLYHRTPLDSLNGVPHCDTAEPGRAGTLFYPDSLFPLPSL